MLNAIQAGIITVSTKQRLAKLEDQKSQLEQQILQERIKRPVLSREQIRCFLDQFKKTDVKDEAQRQQLIDSFVNAVYLYNDKIVLTFNYKDGTKTVSLDDVNSSDLEGFGPPESNLRASTALRLDSYSVGGCFPYFFPYWVQALETAGLESA